MAIKHDTKPLYNKYQVLLPKYTSARLLKERSNTFLLSAQRIFFTVLSLMNDQNVQLNFSNKQSPVHIYHYRKRLQGFYN